MFEKIANTLQQEAQKLPQEANIQAPRLALALGEIPEFGSAGRRAGEIWCNVLG